MKENKLMYILSLCFLIPILWLLNGVVLSDLWEWFVVPVTNFSPLSFWQALGLWLVISFRLYDTEKKRKTEKEMLMFLLVHVANRLLTWGIGYLFYLAV